MPNVDPVSPCPPRLTTPRTFAVVAFKGGVGKTTVTFHLGAVFAQRGLRVLLVDLDPAANLTDTLRAGCYDGEPTIEHLLVRDRAVSFDQVVRHGAFGLDLLPANQRLAKARAHLSQDMAWGGLLAQALQPASAYDVIIIDCPPEADFFPYLALGAATDALAVLAADGLPYVRTVPLIEAIGEVQRRLNPRLQAPRLLFNMVHSRQELDRYIMGEARERYGERVLATTIPQSVRIAEAVTMGEPVTVRDPGGAPAAAFQALAAELLRPAEVTP